MDGEKVINLGKIMERRMEINMRSKIKLSLVILPSHAERANKMD